MARVDQAGSVRLGRQRSPDKHTGRFATKYLRAANIKADGIDLSDLLEMDFTPAERKIFALKTGDVLLTEASGSAMQVGRAALWQGEIDDCCYQNTVIRFRPHVTLPEFALLIFRHFAVSGLFARTSRGVGIQHLGASRFATLPFPLPPLEEQRRIADITELRLSEIREAEARLKSALHNLQQQVCEILAAAVAGELTAETGQTTAPRNDSQSSHSTSSAPQTAQGSLFETPADETFDAPLPSGWNRVRVDAAGEVTLGRQRSPKQQRGSHMHPYLRVANVFEDRIDTTDVLSMNFEPKELATYVLKAGDILLNEGQSPELVGRPAKYRDELPGACFQNTLIRFRAASNVNPDFALLVFRHYLHAGIFRSIARWSTNIAHLGLERFRALPFPVPPLDEQTRIAVEARRRLDIAAAQAVAIRTSLSRLPEMERELFAAAVAGELTPQVPSTESTAALLARLGAPPQEVIDPPTARVESGAPAVSSNRKSSSRQHVPNSDLTAILRKAGRPLSLLDLFGQAGFDRDQPQHVELFYLALRSQLGRTLRQVGDASENAELEAIDAPQ